MNKNACSIIDLSAHRSAQMGINMKIEKTECVYCKNQVNTLLILPDFPIHMGVTDKKFEADIVEDLEFGVCPRCGMIQITHTIPEDILYQEAHYNNVGSGWQEHHEAFARFIAKYQVENIFELGGGTGLLEMEYSKYRENHWTILEPVANKMQMCRAEYLEGFFDEHYVIDWNKGYDAIVHSHVMEHFFRPDLAIEQMINGMSEGKFLFFSIPNLKEMYCRKYTNILNWEHTYYCAEPYISNWLSRNGMEILERVEYLEAHSVFYAARKTDCHSRQTNLLKNMEPYYSENKEMLLTWAQFHRELVHELNQKMEKERRKIFLFGAHSFSQYLVAFGLNTQNIVCVLDNDTNKQGKRLHGGNFKVAAPDCLKGEMEPIVILRAGVHNSEIKKNILEQINNSTIFWE